MKAGSVILGSLTAIVLTFIVSPMIVIIISSFTTQLFLTFPPKGFTLQWYGNIANYPEFLSAIITSILIAISATGSALILGTLASFAVVRHRFFGRDAINSFFASPISLPWIVIGVALLLFYTRIFRIESFAGLIIGHLVITTPYVIRTVTASLTGFDKSLEDASMNLGADEIQTFVKVTLPLIKPGLLSGAVFSFLLSFNDLNLSLFLAGPYIRPFPLVLYNFLFLRALDPTIAALSSVITISTVILGVAMSRFFRLHSVIATR